MQYANTKLKKNCNINNSQNLIIEEKALSDKNEIKSISFKSNWPLSKKLEKNENNTKKAKFLKYDVCVDQKKLIKSI